MHTQSDKQWVRSIYRINRLENCTTLIFEFSNCIRTQCTQKRHAMEWETRTQQIAQRITMKRKTQHTSPSSPRIYIAPCTNCSITPNSDVWNCQQRAIHFILVWVHKMCCRNADASLSLSHYYVAPVYCVVYRHRCDCFYVFFSYCCPLRSNGVQIQKVYLDDREPIIFISRSKQKKWHKHECRALIKIEIEQIVPIQ